MAGNPLARNGKVAYIEIPALDATESAAFYGEVFGFVCHTQRGNASRVSFEDAPQHLIGAFTRERPVVAQPGVMPWIYVTTVEDCMKRIRERGREVVSGPTPEGDTLLVATFRDPAGNLMGIWQFIG